MDSANALSKAKHKFNVSKPKKYISVFCRTFILSNENRIMAAAVSASGSSFAIGAVTPLFETPVSREIFGAYDVTANGQRFIIVYEPGQPNATITLVENWDAELKKK